ncbi:dihydrofolate reductase family protein [Actinomadura barringtoniae]|uniref:Dihydrofolate reductase family protein n=1 Tax=Actinomadura barringtoniae TaxID=1427535 RepID=A0A939PB03_9ACTN|nr:dihydrofolate reductase family protein [Actinomadura barringtoniae]MBO2449321.1 dihydrofolate reductase family protein [Actinomadura barringtoniae]
MRKIIYFVHTSLDGFIEGPNGEFDWPRMEDELSAFSFELSDRADTVMYGRVVWEMMSGYWPNVESISDHPHDLKYAPIWRATPKIVFSRTMESAEHGARVIGKNLVEEVTALKNQPGKDLLLMGGSALPGALTELGLIDEYNIVVHPVVLGGGLPVLGHPAHRVGLELAETRTFDGQTVLLRYASASASAASPSTSA